MLQYQNFVTVDYSFSYCCSRNLAIWFNMTMTAIVNRMQRIIKKISFHSFSPFFFFCRSTALLTTLFLTNLFSGWNFPGLSLLILFFRLGLRCAIRYGLA
ncbi:MAG: hypothetical protein JWR23_1597 [Mucilaginibacter sp.]|nr:hypothetical protein [Mucilaginibacter sp.]